MKMKVKTSVLLLAVVLLSLLPGPVREARAIGLNSSSTVAATCNTRNIIGMFEAPSDRSVIRQNKGAVISGYVTSPAIGCYHVIAVINGTTREYLPVEYAYRGAGFGWQFYIKWPAQATSASLGHPHTIQVMVVTYDRTQFLKTSEGKTTISVVVVP